MSDELSLVSPGIQAHNVIAAKPGTMSAQIIDRLLVGGSTSDKYPLRVVDDKRQQTGWVTAEVLVDSKPRIIRFFVGEECNCPTNEVFNLVDVPYGVSGFMRVKGSTASINVERLKKSPDRASGLGMQIVASVVAHGVNWRNTASEVVSEPFGHEATAKRKKRPRRRRNLSEQRLM